MKISTKRIVCRKFLNVPYISLNYSSSYHISNCLHSIIFYKEKDIVKRFSLIKHNWTDLKTVETFNIILRINLRRSFWQMTKSKETKFYKHKYVAQNKPDIVVFFNSIIKTKKFIFWGNFLHTKQSRKTFKELE